MSDHTHPPDIAYDTTCPACVKKTTLPELHVAFDGIVFPLNKNLVAVESKEGPVQGAGITWDVMGDRTTITVEFCLRGQEPTHISFVEQEDGSYEVVTPPVFLPNTKEF